ncbi:MAG: DUF2341 domain-containing protein [Kiritimatiellae bacterium]|nr:DUF2341 domain-containing protein [Kiritimatiellia bacterium]
MKLADTVTLLAFAALTAEANHQAITFPGYDREETLDDFPALVVFKAGPDGFSYDGFSSPNGYDLRFSNSTETVALDYEIESWDTNGSSYVWVKVPQFTSNCVVHAYWGTPGAEQPACCTNGAVWDASYRAVWHMTPGMRDATTNRVHALPSSTATDAEGPVGRARETGLDKQINLGAAGAVNVTSNFTFSFWARTDYAATKAGYVYRWLNKTYYASYAILCGFVPNTIELYNGNGGITGTYYRTASNISVPDKGWHHYAYTYDGVTFSKYRDGVSVGTTNITFAMTSGSNIDVIIGNSGGQDRFYGALDEFKIAGTARSPDWVYAVYRNQAAAMARSLPIRFPEYDRGETLTNFPALVTLNERVPGFSYLFFKSPDGYDLRFSNATCTAGLNYEIESWNPSGNSYVWVQVPAFTSNCVIRAFWGNLLDTGRLACTTNGATWSDGFRGVWHCNPAKADSSPYAAKTTGPSGDFLRGAAGDYALRSGTLGDRILVTNNGQLSVTTNFTYSFWAKTTSTNQNYVTFSVPDGGARWAIIYGYYGTRNFQIDNSSGTVSGDPATDSSIAAPDDEWHHYAYSYNGSQWAGYRDGASVFNYTRAFELKPMSTNNAFCIGGATKTMFNGGMDEYRMEDQGRSANWLYACYRNQRTRRDGLDYLNAPAFANRGETSDVRPTSATVAGTLSCRLPCAVTLCWGTSDKGGDTNAWDCAAALGTLGSGNVSSGLTGLQPDRNYVYRFFAENGEGSAWSGPFTFHTAPDRKQYQCKVRFAFTGYTAGETLTNFPALVVLGERLNGFSYSQFTSADGSDLRFTDDTGRLLDHEIESWNPSGDSHVWVRIPELKAGTVIWAYWRTTGAFDIPVSQENGAVWDRTFCGVYHLSPALKDATLNINHLADTLTAYDAGAASPARLFDGSAYLTAGSSGSLSVSEAFTLSLWMKTASPNNMYLYGRDNGNGAYQHAMIRDGATGMVKLQVDGGFGNLAMADTYIAVPDSGWHQYVYAYDGKAFSAYRDGVIQQQNVRMLALRQTDAFYVNRAKLGASQGTASNPLIGSLDEFRVENAGRTDSWILASYLTQSSPEAFCTHGVVQTKGTVIMLF